MRKLLISLVAVFSLAGILTVAVEVEPAHALIGAMCDTNRGGFAYVPAVYTGETTARNACIQKLDSADGCWSGWSFYGGPYQNSNGIYWLYFSRQKTSSLWCGFNTTPVRIQVYMGYT